MPKGTPLAVDIVDDEIVIRVGISTLRSAVEGSPDNRLVWLTEDAEGCSLFMCNDITDEAAFAEDVVRALCDEDHDGTTTVHTLFDNAAVAAIENGASGVAEKPKEAVF